VIHHCAIEAVTPEMLADASVDEVKDLHDKSEAMRVYAKQAKNHDMEMRAAEIRLRAERRLGELIKAQKETVGLNPGTRPSREHGGTMMEPPSIPTLADAGIDKKLSARSQKVAALPEGVVGAFLAKARETERPASTNDLLKFNRKVERSRREDEDRARAALVEPAFVIHHCAIEAVTPEMLADASVDEVKDLHDKSEAMRVYAKQAKNHDMEMRAAEIRLRAERRLGELIKAQKETLGLATGGERGGRPKIDGTRAEPSIVRPTLADAGIDKKLSARSQKVAALPEELVAAFVAKAREAERPASTNDLLKFNRKVERSRREDEDRARAALVAPAFVIHHCAIEAVTPEMLADASVDEVKDLHDKSEAMRVYAHQAKNTELEVRASLIRLRAERRLGELIKAQKETDGLNKGGRPLKTPSLEEGVLPTLAEAGIDYKLSHRAQKVAALPEGVVEAFVAKARETERPASTNDLLKFNRKVERSRREDEDRARAALVEPAFVIHHCAIEAVTPEMLADASVDEVKDLHDKSEAMRVYAHNDLLKLN
jgi:uncharacterized protein YdiU (UPF0061 family)